MSSLNPQQLEAVQYYGSPLLVIAGAGSGKTMVITHKIHYLIDELGFPPDKILAITFTNKAAREMQHRVGRLLGPQQLKPYVSTFHALCGDILRRYFQHLGRSPNFIIWDAQDQKRLLTQILEKMKVNDQHYPLPKVQFKIERCKNNLISAEAATEFNRSGMDPTEAEIYRIYQNHLITHNALDFNDMLYYTNILIMEYPNVLQELQDQFNYVLVDEYQDTNFAQYNLVRELTKSFQNLTVVGDFDQNIYSWRGANVKNILRFEKDFNNAKTIMLEQNYRSSATILNAANAVIQNNQNRRDKNLWTENSDGNKIIQHGCNDEHDEARYIVKQIHNALNQGDSLDDIVVLYRINAQSRVIEEKIAQANMPYQVIGGFKYFDRREIKDIIGYLRIIHNPHDDQAFARIANMPARDIGVTTIKKCMEQAAANECSIFELFKRNQIDLPNRSMKAVDGFWQLILGLQETASQNDADGLSFLISEVAKKSGYMAMLERQASAEAEDRLENINELISLAREEVLDLGEFLNKIALATDTEAPDKDNDPKITLMTFHNAKGLEFNTVFIAGTEEGLLPHFRSQNNPDELEEERRLCYVGITRGKKQVVMTHAQRRTLFGEPKAQLSSRFLDEIPDELKEVSESSPSYASHRGGYGAKSYGGSSRGSYRSGGSSSYAGNSARSRSGSYASTPTPDYTVGEAVSHSSWGQGRIVRIEGDGEKAVLFIKFGSGIKKLIAKYAPLKKMSTT